MHIYWKQWTKPLPTKDELNAIVREFRTLLGRMVDERREMEKVARRIDKSIG